MTNTQLSEIIIFIMFFIVVIYLYIFFVVYHRRYKRLNQLADLHLYRMINSIYKQNLSIEDSYTQLLTNYLIHIKYSTNKDNNLQDSLEKTIYCFDTYSDKKFRYYFGEDKKEEIRSFIIMLLNYIKINYPFSKTPQKEAALLKIVKEALEKENKELGINAINQLSEEIEIKGKSQIKLETQNKISTIISIVGVILTIFFGIISFLKF